MICNRKILINASNLHVGGGIQAATSFLAELSQILPDSNDLAVLASSEVNYNLHNMSEHTEIFDGYRIINSYGFNFFKKSFHSQLNRYDTVFTVFGPLYRWRTSFTNVVGFAQAWIIYPDNECYKKLSFLARLKTRAKFWIQSQFFKRADVIVVELEHVKEGLVRELGIDPSRIHVIRNCISSVYLNKPRWSPVELPKVECDLRLGFVGRNYPHKNTEIFPAIAHLLESDFKINAKFFVTFTEDEWNACTEAFRAKCINLGPLSVSQCPSFYERMDAVVFPSLLECFSATPLEAMAMGKPLFVSDRPFNRDVCKDHGYYFDPASPYSAARLIADVFKAGGPDAQKVRAAREHAIDFSSPKDRAEKYLALLLQYASQNTTESME